MKPIIYTTEEIKLITCINLYRELNVQEVITDPCWVMIENLWQNINENTPESRDFWTQCSTLNIKKYYLSVKHTEIENEQIAWKYFSFVYYNIIYSLNGFSIPEELTITPSPTSGRELEFNNSGKYDQFFDVYDVLNEVLVAKDKLTKYLKVYQVIELLSYRAKFITLLRNVKSSGTSLIRGIESVTDVFRQSETDVITANITILFPNIAANLNLEMDSTDRIINVACENFLKKVYKINKDEQNHYKQKDISGLIYKLRNSIVHNKETEFHFTFNNFEDYKAIIPLLDFLIEQILLGITDLIEQTRNNPVAYSDKSISLY